MGFVIRGRITGNKPFFERGLFKMYGFLPNEDCIDQVSLSESFGNITIKGELPTLVEDKEYEIEVEYEQKGKYESYVVKRFLNNPMNMTEKESFNFLSELTSDTIATNILQTYPEFVKMLINNQKDEIDVALIKGVGEFTLNRIEEKIKQNIMFFDVINEFKEYELTLSQVQKIYAKYTSIDVLREKMEKNPYKCLCSIGGIGFKTADNKILNKNRDLATSEVRMAECILYQLSENENNGHTWIRSNELYSLCAKTTPQCMTLFESVLQKDNRIYFSKEFKTVAKQNTYFTEKEVSKRLLRFLDSHRIFDKIDYSKYDCVDDFALTEQQRLSLEYACKYNIYILAGYAGAGKTSSTKALLNMLDDYNYSYALMAPTGKASKNFFLNTGRESKTIHRGLAFDPKEGFKFNENNPLQYDYVIVDEATMINISLMLHLLRAIRSGSTKLIFICDPAQIPSVGCGNCIQDMIASKMFPVIFLNKVFRYKDGGIAKITTDTRQGKPFLIGDGVEKFGDDFVFVPTNKDGLVDKILSAYKKCLNKGGDVSDIVVISAYNVGEFGTLNINSKIQNLVNPSDGSPELSYVKDKHQIVFREKDKVMQIKNNYNAELFESEDQKQDSVGTTEVFNGDDGTVVKIGKNSRGAKYMVVDFDGQKIIYRESSIDSLILGYAISAHKSQGSGYNYIIAITPPTHKFFLNRNLLYVMYTRAKKFMYNIGTADTVEVALKKSENLNRQTFLQGMLESGVEAA